MCGAWNGGLAGAEQYARDATIRSSITRAMGYWFANDFTVPACLDSGGTAACPCGTPGLWNTNWYSNIIGTPELVSMSCLLLNDTLSADELAHCVTITGRAYGTFTHKINGVGTLTGANALDVAKIGIDLALLTLNLTIITDAYQRVHNELQIATGAGADGVRPDGSFGQHGGLLYNGNYGKDYTNDIVDLEVEAGGTQFQATPASQTALATLFDGDRWMIYRNVLTGVLHWDFSVLGRFISFPTADFTQATGSILLNLTKIDELGQQWGADTLRDFATTLARKSSSANAGQLEGNRMFWNNDYMVHRGANYVTTVKMYSVRSRNSECTNLANPFGFHLSDGALRTYLQGNEYEDIAAAMDWNLVPGITVDYGATPLNCGQTQFTGIEKFVGGVSDETLGVAAMRYSNPLTHSLQWQKAWFFLEDDVQLVMVANISSASDASVVSVLDQRLHAGEVVLDSANKLSAPAFAKDRLRGARTLWHGGVGYGLPAPADGFALSLQVGPKTGNWSAIGTSTQPPSTVDLFAASLVHENATAPLVYTIFPGTGFAAFRRKHARASALVQVLRNDARVSAVLDARGSSVMAVFWGADGGSVDLVPRSPVTFTISANGTAALMFDWVSGKLTVSDPTQTLSAVAVTLRIGGSGGRRMAQRLGGGLSGTLVFALPSGGLAGSSVSENVYH